MRLFFYAAATADAGPNIWGALACVVAFAAALLAVLVGVGEFLDARITPNTPGTTTGTRVRFGSRVSASAITFVAAGTVWSVIMARRELRKARA